MADIARRFEKRVESPDEGMRVDRWIATHCPEFPRSAASDEGTSIVVNGNPAKKSKRLAEGDTVCVEWTESVFDRIEGQSIALDVLHEDEDLLVIHKPQGLVVHPGAGNPDGTVVNALVHRYGESFFTLKQGEEDADDEETERTSLRPGIVHRLDKETSGVMAIALNRESHQELSGQFKDRTVEKHYIAIVCGRPSRKRGRIETMLVRDSRDRKKFTVGREGRGKHAVTDYLVLRQWEYHALVRVRLLTGRTHQIRVHFRSIGCPILGDPLYGKRDSRFPDATLMLHAFSLALDHPRTKQRMRFRAPMPARFKAVLLHLIGKEQKPLK